MKIAIIPGHNKERPGAFCDYFQFYEWEWAECLCSEISLYLSHQKKIRVDQHLRKETGNGSVDSIRKLCTDVLNPEHYDLVLEFHCNGHEDRSANGHETLVWYRTNEDNFRTAAYLDSIQGDVFETRSRRPQGYLPVVKGSRGWPLLVYCNAPVILLEPGFLTNRADAESLIKNRGRFAFEISQFLTKFGG